MYTHRNILAAVVLTAGVSGRLYAQAPASVTLAVPAMAGPLALGPVPVPVAAGALGTWTIDGAFSGLGLIQSEAAAGDRKVLADVGNGQLFLQKTDGLLQFYIQAGLYAIPVIGAPYSHALDSGSTWNKLFGPVPQVFAKFAPSDDFSVQLGKLPTLIGAEYSFTFENVNVERGLLWNQEPAVSRGIQFNAVHDPLAFALSLNDGFYSDRFNWLSGSAAWTIDASNVLVFAAGANLGRTGTNDFATPRAQNNSSIYNLIYTYTLKTLMLTPYLQYTHIASRPYPGVGSGAATWSGALLGSYGFTPHVVLAARAEYVGSSADCAKPGAANLLYGPCSAAASVTLTPTVTVGHWFGRADLAIVGISRLSNGDGFGHHGDGSVQARGLFEAGYVF